MIWCLFPVLKFHVFVVVRFLLTNGMWLVESITACDYELLFDHFQIGVITTVEKYMGQDLSLYLYLFRLEVSPAQRHPASQQGGGGR